MHSLFSLTQIYVYACKMSNVQPEANKYTVNHDNLHPGEGFPLICGILNINLALFFLVLTANWLKSELLPQANF